MRFDLHGQTAGLIGLGKIALMMAGILKDFGCRLLGYDFQRMEAWDRIGIESASLDDLYAHSDIISLHCSPLRRITSSIRTPSHK
jgi:D-lactate dehydrogenase